MNRSYDRHLIGVIIFLGLLSLHPGVVWAAPNLQATPDAVVAAKGLNLRQGPGKQFPVITVLPNETGLKVIGRSDPVCQWVQVRTAEDVQGWVAGGAAFIRLNISCASIPSVEQGEAPPPPPATTPTAIARPTTGTILKDHRGGGGSGKLTIENYTDTDGVVALVREEATQVAVIAFYIRHGEYFMVGGVPNGRYKLVFTTGQNWDEAKRKFTVGERYQRFKEPGGVRDAVLDYDGNDSWTATLHGVKDGRHPTQGIGEAEFPDL